MEAYHAECWEEYGKWRVADTNNMLEGSARWYVEPFIWGLAPKDFVKMLEEEYNAVGFHIIEKETMPTGMMLLYYFTSEKDANKYRNALNAKAKEKNFFWNGGEKK